MFTTLSPCVSIPFLDILKSSPCSELTGECRICGKFLLSVGLVVLSMRSTGACILYGISRVVIGENKTFLGGEAYLKQRGVEVVVMENQECRELMELFIKEKPEVWSVTFTLEIHVANAVHEGTRILAKRKEYTQKSEPNFNTDSDRGVPA